MDNTLPPYSSHDPCRPAYFSIDATSGSSNKKKHRHRSARHRKSGNVALGNPSPRRQPEVQGRERRWLSQRRSDRVDREFGRECKGEERPLTCRRHRRSRTLSGGASDVGEQPWGVDLEDGGRGRDVRLNEDNPGEVPHRMTQETSKEEQGVEERSLLPRQSSRAQHGDRVLRNRRYRRPFDDHRHTKRLFTPEIKKFLKDWLVRRRDHPYPNRDEKKRLAVQTGLTYIQICNWFANWRRKLKNAGDEQRTTWGHLIKSYNTQAQGNVEQFSICSDDSIWEQQAFNEPVDDDEETEEAPSLSYASDATAMDHSYSVIQNKNAELAAEDAAVQEPSENQPQCFQVTSTTTEEEDAQTTLASTSATNKYASLNRLIPQGEASTKCKGYITNDCNTPQEVASTSKYKDYFSDRGHTIPEPVASARRSSKYRGNIVENYRNRVVPQEVAPTSGGSKYKDHFEGDYHTLPHTATSTRSKNSKKKRHIADSRRTIPKSVPSKRSESSKYKGHIVDDYPTIPQSVASTSGVVEYKGKIAENYPLTSKSGSGKYEGQIAENGNKKTQSVASSSGRSKYKSYINVTPPHIVTYAPNVSHAVEVTTQMAPHCGSSGSSKYKSHIMEKYLRDLKIGPSKSDDDKPETTPNGSSVTTTYESSAGSGERNTRNEKKRRNVQKTKETCPPLVLSKWLESAAKFQPTKSYILWTQSKKDAWHLSRGRSNAKVAQHQNDVKVKGEEQNKMVDGSWATQGHQREELDAAEALTRLSGIVH